MKVLEKKIENARGEIWSAENSVFYVSVLSSIERMNRHRETGKNTTEYYSTSNSLSLSLNFYLSTVGRGNSKQAMQAKVKFVAHRISMIMVVRLFTTS